MVGQFLHDFHFLRPAWLLTLPLLWGLTFWLMRKRSDNHTWSQVIDADLLPALRLDVARPVARPWPWLALAWTLAGIALAGPSWQRIQSPAYRVPAAWMLVLDLSPSMTASDLAPDRVTRARYAINDLLAAARDNRVGLLVFSDEPHTVTPLTQDIATIQTLLPPLAPNIMPSAGDHLGPALEKATQLIERVAAKDRHIIVLTDGFDDPAAALASAAQAKQKGIVVSVVGIGTSAGAPVANSTGHFLEDAQGKTQLAKLDGEKLRQLATVGGGRYVTLGQIPELIASLKPVNDLPGEAISEQGIQVADWRDGGFWLLPPVLLLAALLSRRGWA